MLSSLFQLICPVCLFVCLFARSEGKYANKSCWRRGKRQLHAFILFKSAVNVIKPMGVGHKFISTLPGCRKKSAILFPQLWVLLIGLISTKERGLRIAYKLAHCRGFLWVLRCLCALWFLFSDKHWLFRCCWLLDSVKGLKPTKFSGTLKTNQGPHCHIISFGVSPEKLTCVTGFSRNLCPLLWLFFISSLRWGSASFQLLSCYHVTHRDNSLPT